VNTEATCEQCLDLLPDYVDSMLSHDESVLVERHLAHCMSCNQALAELRWIADLARQADEARAASTWAAIQAHLAPNLPVATESLFASGDHLMEFTDQQPDLDLVPSRPRPARGEWRPRRRTSIMASVAAIVLIALGATVFALHPHRGSTTPSTSVQVTPSPTSVPDLLLPETIASDILSPNDIWAIGTDMPVSPQLVSQILHFDGSQLHVIATYANTQLKAISMDSATDGWAVGVTGPQGTANEQPVVLHYTDGHWIAVTTPDPAFLPFEVQMVSANDGWFFGSKGEKGMMFHYVNGTWNAIQSNAPLFFHVQMLSDSEGWAYAEQNGNSVWQYHDGQWSESSTPTNPIQSLGANSSTDAWLVVGNCGAAPLVGSGNGYAALRPMSCGREELLHYDGSGWNTVQLSAGAEGNVVQFFTGGQWLGVSNIPVALHNQNGQWVPTTLPIRNASTEEVVNIVPQPDGSALALSVTLRLGAPPSTVMHVYRYSNGTWATIH
jgi:Putative zinc-finger